MKKKVLISMVAMSIFGSSLAFANDVDDPVIGWTHYTGWEPIGYMESSGIMEKYNKIYNTNVEIRYIGDYIDSLTLYNSKELNGVAVTNMDIMTNRSSTAIVVGDYSNGNDALVMKGFKTLEDAKGSDLNLVEFSVSHYLLGRCLETKNLSINDFNLVNTSDADIPSVFENGDEQIAVSWNPMLNTIKSSIDVVEVCSSKDFPGEIIDMIVVGDEVSENAKMAIVDAWYETLSVLNEKSVLEELSKQAGSTVNDFTEQLKTTAIFYKKDDVVKFINDEKLKETMSKVINFGYENGIYDSIEKPTDLGVQYPDGSIYGAKENIILKFTDKYLN